MTGHEPAPIDGAARARELVAALRDPARALDAADRADALALLTAAHHRGRDAELLAEQERRQREGIEREANALAAVVADILDGTPADEVVDDLPHNARRRVLAYRHASMPGMLGLARPRDQFGPLPKVPPRSSVMRERRRTVDG